MRLARGIGETDPCCWKLKCAILSTLLYYKRDGRGATPPSGEGGPARSRAKLERQTRARRKLEMPLSGELSSG